MLNCELLEACKQKVRSEGIASLPSILAAFVPSNVHQRELVSQQDSLLTLRDEISRIEARYSAEVAVVRRVCDEELARLSESRDALQQELERVRSEYEQSQLDNEFEEDEVPIEEAVLLEAQLALIRDRMDALNGRAAEEVAAIREREGRDIDAQRAHAAALSGQIQTLRHRDAAHCRAAAADPLDPACVQEAARRARSRQGILRRPEAVREHAALLRGVAPPIMHAASPEDAAARVRSLAVEEVAGMLATTRLRPAQCPPKARRSLAASENGRILAAASPPPAAVGFGGVPEGVEGEYLRRRLAAVGHANMLRRIRPADLGAPRVGPGGGYAGRVAFQAEVLRLEDHGPETRAVLVVDGRRHLTSRGCLRPARLAAPIAPRNAPRAPPRREPACAFPPPSNSQCPARRREGGPWVLLCFAREGERAYRAA